MTRVSNFETCASGLHVVRISTTEQLRALAGGWNCLTREMPFRRWEWLAAWWRHFGDPPRQLYVLAVYDQGGALAGVAPWYAEDTKCGGRVLRFLGSGAVCSDYLSVLSTREHEDAVAGSLAHWMAAAATPTSRRSGEDSWDLLELNGVATSDSAVTKLVRCLNEQGCSAHHRAGVNCWRIDLPATWPEYVSQFSKSRRRKIRRWETAVRENDVELRVAQSDDQRAEALRILVRLHQARRRDVGEPGCFAEGAFSRFFTDVVDNLGPQGTVQLAWIEQAGQPIAADVFLTSPRAVYLYQSGIDPGKLHLEPDHLSSVLLIRRAIEESRRVVDFLRGDEPYKPSWGARPVSMQNIRVAANRVTPQVRHGMWLAGYTVKNWVKTGIRLTRMN